MDLVQIIKKTGFIALCSLISANLLFGKVDDSNKNKTDPPKIYFKIQENKQKIKDQQLKFKENIWNLQQKKYDDSKYFDFRFKQSILYKRLKLEMEGLGATNDDIEFSKEIMQTIWNNIKEARDKKFTKLEDRVKSFSDYTPEEFNNIVLKTTHNTLVKKYGCTPELGSNLSKGLKNRKNLRLDCSGVSTFYYALNQIYDISPIGIFFAPPSNVSVTVKLKNNPKYYFWEVTNGTPETIYEYQYLFHMPRVVNEGMEKGIYFTPLTKSQINAYLLYDIGVEWLIKKANPEQSKKALREDGTGWVLKGGNLKEAGKYFRKALVAHPRSTLSNFHMGSYHFSLYEKFKGLGKNNIANIHNSIARSYYARVIELDRYYKPAYKRTEDLLNKKIKEEYEKALAKRENTYKKMIQDKRSEKDIRKFLNNKNKQTMVGEYYQKKLEYFTNLDGYYNDKAMPHLLKAEKLKDEVKKIIKQPNNKGKELEVIKRYTQALPHYELAKMHYYNRVNYFRNILLDNKLHLDYNNNEPRPLEWHKKPDWAFRDLMKYLYSVKCVYDNILDFKQLVEGKNKINEKFYNQMSQYYSQEMLKWKKAWEQKKSGKK